MLKVWAGLEARSFLKASAEAVSKLTRPVCYCSNFVRLNDASNTTNFLQIFNMIFFKLGTQDRLGLGISTA